MATGEQNTSVDPGFLQRHAEFHEFVFGAFAELIDNSVDADAAHLRITVFEPENPKTCRLILTDDGVGMGHDDLYDCLSFGKSKKAKANKIGQYGVGFKSGTMRIADDVLVFSKDKTTQSIGFLSQTWLKTEKKTEVKVVVLTWDRPQKSNIAPQLIKPAAAKLNESLKTLFTYSPYKKKEDLMREFKRIKTETGTRLVLFNLKKRSNGQLELNFNVKGDIQISEACRIPRPGEAKKDIPIDYSFREYCSYLYMKPKMAISLIGSKVQIQRVDALFTKTKAYSHKIPGVEKVQVVFGFSPQARQKDLCGMMLYYRNRLVKSFMRIGIQLDSNILGTGVIGVAQLDFLSVTNNKQDFIKNEFYFENMKRMEKELANYWYSNFDAEDKEIHERIQQLENMKPEDFWVQCDKCRKWRKLPFELKDSLEDNPNTDYNTCFANEEEWSPDDEIILTFEDSILSGDSNKKPKKPAKRISSIPKKEESESEEIDIPIQEPPAKKKKIKSESSSNISLPQVSSSIPQMEEDIPMKDTEPEIPKKPEMIKKFSKPLSVPKVTQMTDEDDLPEITVNNLKRKLVIEDDKFSWNGNLVVFDQSRNAFAPVTHLQSIDLPIKFPEKLTVKKNIKLSHTEHIKRTDFHIDCLEKVSRDSYEFKRYFSHLSKHGLCVQISIGERDILIFPPSKEELSDFSEVSKLRGVILSKEELKSIAEKFSDPSAKANVATKRELKIPSI